jgi:hypothetical protein
MARIQMRTQEHRNIAQEKRGSRKSTAAHVMGLLSINESIRDVAALAAAMFFMALSHVGLAALAAISRHASLVALVALAAVAALTARALALAGTTSHARSAGLAGESSLVALALMLR